MKATIGVDLGTQGVKAAIFTMDGRRRASSFRPSRLHRPKPGVVEEDPEFQVQNVCETIRECVKLSGIASSDFAAIAIAGQMAGIIGIDKDGKHITPYDSWLDTRCAPYIETMNATAGSEVIEKTGGPASFNHGPKILWWMHKHPSTFRAVRSFVQPGGYAAMRLCGLSAVEAFIDTTYLHFSGFANTRSERWSGALCKHFLVPECRLPRIVKPHKIIGELTPSMARLCGLRHTTPVVAGCGDTAASFLACGATQEGVCVDVAGTAGVFAATTKRFRPDCKHKTLSCAHAATPGLWHSYAYINGSGMNLEWFVDILSFFATKKSRQDIFQALDTAAHELGVASHDPFFVPHLGGRVSPGWPGLRGAWAGLDWSQKAPALWKALLEGSALEYAVYRKVLRSLYPELKLKELRVTGGGEKSALWNQMKADVLGMPVARIANGEGAPLGSAMLAAFGVGLIKDLDKAARSWVPRVKPVKPSAARGRIYLERLERYEALLDTLNNWSKR